jgi:O-antigen/teichoic acid export membrane protein
MTTITPMRWLSGAANAVLRRATALMASTVAASALGMVFWVLAARLADPQQVGAAAAAASAVTLLGVLGQLSLNSVLVRFLPTAASRAVRLLVISYLLTAVVAAALGGAFILGGFADDFLGGQPYVLPAFCVAVVGWAFVVLHEGALTGLRRTRWVPVASVGIAVSKIALLPLLVTAGVSAAVLLAWAAPIVVVSLAVAAMLFVRIAPSQSRRHDRTGAMPPRREVLSFLAAENVNGILNGLVLFAPPVLVTAVAGAQANAYFYVPWLIASACLSLYWNISMSLVVAAASDPARIRRHIWHAVRLLAIIGFGGGLVLAVGGPAILGLLGSDYADSGGTSLRMIGLALPFVAVSVLYTSWALIAKRAWAISIVQMITAVAFLGGAVIALQRFGLAGAAGAYLVTVASLALVLAPVTASRLRRLARQLAPSGVTSPRDGLGGVPAAKAVAGSVSAADRSAVASPGEAARPSVAVIIPCLNEALSLPYLFERLPAEVDEVILVDGGSTDDSVAVARRLWPAVVVVGQTRSGKGNALACGFVASTADILVTVDADGSADPQEIPRFVAALRAGADFAKGSRFVAGGGSDDITRVRRLGNGFLTALVNRLFGARFSDLCYGYNAFWRGLLPTMQLPDIGASPAARMRHGDGFEIETMLILRAAAARARIVEVPSHEAHRLHGTSNLSAYRDGRRVLRTILREYRALPSRRQQARLPIAPATTRLPAPLPRLQLEHLAEPEPVTARGDA